MLLDLPGTVLVTPAEAVEFDEDEAGVFDEAASAALARLQEVRLAREALALAEAKLEFEREKLTLGLSSNYQLALFETDLVNAQVNDVSARIG